MPGPWSLTQSLALTTTTYSGGLLPPAPEEKTNLAGLGRGFVACLHRRDGARQLVEGIARPVRQHVAPGSSPAATTGRRLPQDRDRAGHPSDCPADATAPARAAPAHAGPTTASWPETRDTGCDCDAVWHGPMLSKVPVAAIPSPPKDQHTAGRCCFPTHVPTPVVPITTPPTSLTTTASRSNSLPAKHDRSKS
jgi:hypothetical protein